MLEQSFTPAEVASNNGKNGSKVWIIIKGVVYDVTSFLEDHPGGAELITEYAGKDATKAFRQAGHSSDATSDLKKYRIGVIAENSSAAAAKSQQLAENGSQSTLAGTKSEKRKRIKFLFCV